MLQLTDASEYLPPRRLQVVALRDRDVEERLDRLHVLCLHLPEIIQERELRKRADKSIPLQLQVEEAHNMNGGLEPFQAELDGLEVVCILQGSGQTSKERDPRNLEHWFHMDEV